MDECWLSLTVLTVVTLLGTAQSLMNQEIRLVSFRGGKTQMSNKDLFVDVGIRFYLGSRVLDVNPARWF
jgi:hypothetical protein